jgi:sortase A
MIAVFLAGLFLLLYPHLRGTVVDRELKQTAGAFLEQMGTLPTVPAAPPGTAATVPVGPPVITPTVPEPSEPQSGETAPQETEPAENRPYQQLWKDMNSYNQFIYEAEQAGLSDEAAYEASSFILADYGLDSEIFGVISIPPLDIEMPIYLGASYQHMADGAAHLTQTSLPIGGSNTNCVIAGHRGWRGASYFLTITDLKEGDEVLVTNLWETLRYRVVEIQIIDPNDIDAILIQEGRELLTLLTCYRVASGEKLRYLVICERTFEEVP